MADDLSKSQKKNLMDIKETIHIQELAPVYQGKKPGLFFSLNKSVCSKEKIKDIIESLGLSIVFWKEYGSLSFSVAQEKEIAKEIKKTRLNEDFGELGKLLGYPECCIDENMQRVSRYPYREAGDFELPFEMNIFFNSNSFGDNLDHKKLMDFTKKCDHRDVFFVSHIPCSMSCKKSLKKGVNNKTSLKKMFPDLAERYEKWLKKGFIVFDVLDFIYFDYEKLEENKIKIKNMQKTPLAKKRDLFNLEGYIELDDGQLTTINNEVYSYFKSILFY